MEARAELAEGVGKADDARIAIFKRRVRQLAAMTYELLEMFNVRIQFQRSISVEKKC